MAKTTQGVFFVADYDHCDAISGYIISKGFEPDSITPHGEADEVLILERDMGTIPTR